jgi:predicted small lipoprotein YifL
MFILKTGAAAILLLLVLQLQGCGRKGPLFMPPASAQPAPPAQAQPAQTPAVPNQTIPSQTEPNK